MKLTKCMLLLLSVGVGLCVLGISLIIGAALSFRKCEKLVDVQESVNYANETATSPAPSPRVYDQCAPSNEAVRARLYETLHTVMETYYSFYPNKIIWHPQTMGDDLKRFRPYNCSPRALKERSDASRRMHENVERLKRSVNTTLLRPRELKALFQLAHFLKTNFGYSYGENYYAGDWMMGPSRFCWEPICSIGTDLQVHFSIEAWAWRPRTMGDVSYLIEQLQGYKVLIEQYQTNIKYGMSAGMVRSVEECDAGYHSFTRRFFSVALRGSIGVLDETFALNLMHQEFLSILRGEVKEKWLLKTGNTVQESINSSLVEYIGKPLNSLLIFLRNDYKLQCVPSEVSSGLATLPLAYVYFNGTRTTNRTTRTLPFGEKLNGTETYKSMLYFFTTTEDLSPEKLFELGKAKLDYFYSEAVAIAVNYTKQLGNGSVEAFKKMLQHQSNYFNNAMFPSNESDNEAYMKCSNLTAAKMFCPERYKAFQNWTTFVRATLSLLEPKTADMFHFTGNKRTTPSCPLDVVPNFNPSTGAQSFVDSDANCLQPCRYKLPFFMDNFGPAYNAYSVAGHEGRPGHHTQLQGVRENFNDGCWDQVSWLDGKVVYPWFQEGWALYAENPLLAQGTDIYQDNPVQMYGMLKWQIWRALRLVVDTGLHYKGMKRSEALQYHANFAWDTTDKAAKDVTRYQSNPGQATAYMIGQLEIWRLRELTKNRLQEVGKEFDEKDFHYQVLSQGQSPLEYLRIHIDKYIECMVADSEDCDTLENNNNIQSRYNDYLVNERWSNKVFPVHQFTEHFA